MRDFGKMKRIIIKIGSSSITTSDLSINKNLIDFLMKSFLDFKKMGIGVALVSSGAIASSVIAPQAYSQSVQGASTEQSIQDTRVYVLESDISNTQGRVSVQETENRY